MVEKKGSGYLGKVGKSLAKKGLRNRGGEKPAGGS